jgi:hypothetical protein
MKNPEVDWSLLREANLTGVAITASLRPDGSLGPAGGLVAKLLAAVRERTLPRIHTVLVAQSQELTDLGLEEDLHNRNTFRDPAGDFHVIRAATVAEAVALLATDARTRWGGIDCSLPPPDPDFVGRETLFQEVGRFVAGNQPGYLVLIGGMGRGKSAFMAELIHRAWLAGEGPVFHIIRYHPSSSGTPVAIATCLLYQLLRKHPVSAMVRLEWDKRKLIAEERLEALLHLLSERVQRREIRPEVLYIDAADQAEVQAGTPLMPGTLRDLPPGISCIISSRAQLGWLGSSRAATRLDFEAHVYDRTDIGLLLRRGAHGVAPLPEPLVADIIRSPTAPVFLTVIGRLRQLADALCPPDVRRRLLSEAGPWAMPPEQLVGDELICVLRRAESAGLGDHRVWQTLGTLAIAREDLSEDTLRDLGPWEDPATGRVLRLAANFFAPRPLLPAPDVPYRFDHPGYQREVVAHIPGAMLAELHRCLGEGCFQTLRREAAIPAEGYACRNLIHHLSAIESIENLVQVFRDADLLARVARGSQDGFGGTLKQLMKIIGSTLYNDVKMKHLIDDFDNIARILSTVYPTGKPEPIAKLADKHAKCNLCDSRSIVHGVYQEPHYFEGHHEWIWWHTPTQFYSICMNCYWHYIQEELFMRHKPHKSRYPDQGSGTLAKVLEAVRFDYRTNVYWWNKGGELPGLMPDNP